MMEKLTAVPFIGIVEDVDDPEKLGRVRVRVINHHGDEIPTADLDWATVAHPTTSTGVKGAGMSPTWLIVGSTVIGFYFDGEQRNVPIVTGTLGNIPNNDKALHSVNKLAREEKGDTISPIGPEPVNDATSVYPHNRTISTPGGHVIELDDTDGNQRIHIRHATGAYLLINNDGQIVIRSDDNRFDVSKGKYTNFATKDVKHETKGKFEIDVQGNFSVTSKGNCSITSTGTVAITGAKVSING